MTDRSYSTESTADFSLQEPLAIKKRLLLWNLFLTSLRKVLGGYGAMEVHTPTLVTSPGTEPYLDFFVTQDGSFLPPSPEYSLKKLLAELKSSLFEIRTCFRMDWPSPWHRQEFFMLEWYQVGEDESRFHNRVAQFVIDLWAEFFAQCAQNHLVQYVADAHLFTGSPGDVRCEFGDAVLNLEIRLPFGCACSLTPLRVTVPIVSVSRAFQVCYQFDLKPETSTKELLDLAQSLGLHAQESWNYDDLFLALMLERIEPKLRDYPICLVTQYPPSQAALAELNSEGWASRFELYVHGIEIGNAYQELQDATEYSKRWYKDNQKRRSLGKQQIPWDEGLYRALLRGWPQPTCGIAIGLERLFAIFLQQDHIHFWSPLFKGS